MDFRIRFPRRHQGIGIIHVLVQLTNKMALDFAKLFGLYSLLLVLLIKINIGNPASGWNYRNIAIMVVLLSSVCTPQIDGKELFCVRQARSCLSYKHFSTILSNIKELNSQNQTK